jgi:DNA repair protein RecN (Recombination protein N)
MLSRITIHNLVIVRNLDLAIESGMTALTGETGAGKSILIDALGLALGDKADAGLIRKGTDKAEVSAVFELADDEAQAWLEARDLAADGECLLRRVLVREGRSRAYINGTPVTQALLRELGALLVDIHGQHAHQSLLQKSAQRRLVDAYGGLQQMVRGVADRYREWQRISAAIEELARAGADRANRLDYLRFQIDEMSDTVVDAATLAALDEEHNRLANADQLLNDCAALLQLLSDDDQGLRHQLHQAERSLDALVAIDPQLGEVRDLIANAGIQVDEAETSLGHYRDGIDIDPARLADIDLQLGKLHDLARKHRVDRRDLGELLESLQAEVEQLDRADTDLASLERQQTAAGQAYRESAAALSEARAAAGAELATKVTDSMQALGMHGGLFDVVVTRDADKPGLHGDDQVVFTVAANPGQPAAPLRDVASGGELSRISLAIQVATADCGSIPTLIFDEVDVGIGGAVAEIVGQLLRRLGEQRQVLCVTHLPQVAAQAHHQARVFKATDGTSTQTHIEQLDADARINEVARMLGGVEITDQTRRTADEMIRSAQVTKRSSTKRARSRARQS